MSIMRLAALAVAAMLLVGCTQQEIPFDHASAGDIKVIGLLTPALPSGPDVILASSPAQSFGLIGAIVDASMQANRETHFKDLLSGQHFSAEEALTQCVTEKLQAAGYTVTPVPVARPKDDFLKQYPVTTGPKVDAYLDIVATEYGYVAAGVGAANPYRPAFAMTIKLVRAKDTAILMQDNIIYNPVGSYSNWVTISPDPTYQFSDFDSLMADPAKAVSGLKIAFDKSAGATGTLIK
ncbi:MAG: hypothetical protein ABWY00_12615 [Dongiaceae bacterium]